jgi:hypothetical protein
MSIPKVPNTWNKEIRKMTNTPDQPKVDQLQTRNAAEWGLASLLLGGLLAVMAMLTLQINLQMYLNPKGWWPNDVRPVQYVGIAGAIVLAGLTGTSIAFGIRSLMLAYKHAQPTALGWLGTMTSVFALLLWIGTLVNLFSVLDMLITVHGLQHLFH